MLSTVNYKARPAHQYKSRLTRKIDRCPQRL